MFIAKSLLLLPFKNKLVPCIVVVTGSQMISISLYIYKIIYSDSDVRVNDWRKLFAVFFFTSLEVSVK